MEEREQNSSMQSERENRERNDSETDKNAIYSEVYEHRTPQGSIRSFRSGTEYQNARLNEADLSDVVVEDANLPQRETSPPLLTSTPGLTPTITTSTVITKSHQPLSTTYSKVKDTKESYAIEFDNRDPQNLQESIKVNFADIIAEPHGTHSFNTIWGSSYKVYSVTKFWLYRIMTLLLGIPSSLFWGIYFACLAFVGVWCIIPCIRAFSIKCNYFGKFWRLLIRTILDPIFESVGLVFSQIRVKMTQQRND